MGKLYEATAILWSPSRNEYVMPGEKIEIDDELAEILLRKKVIKPAVYKRKATKKKVAKEQDNGTND
jgi:hypothetical protein